MTPSTQPYTTLATDPQSREKPYLYLDSSGNYNVFVPALRTNASWVRPGRVELLPGSSLAISTFYVAKPTDTAATINAALSAGQNLIFTPGIYQLTSTIQVNRADTVVLGMGFATLVPNNGVTLPYVGW